jgi:hypothetical protein
MSDRNPNQTGEPDSTEKTMTENPTNRTNATMLGVVIGASVAAGAQIVFGHAGLSMFLLIAGVTIFPAMVVALLEEGEA